MHQRRLRLGGGFNLIRYLFAVGVVTLSLACGGDGSGGSAGPLGGGIDSFGVQKSDAPSGLQSCSVSGDINKSSDKDVTGEWGYQQKHGATAGYMAVYADGSGNCKSFIQATNGGTGKLMGSIVVQFKDEASATAGYNGLFGANPTDLKGKAGFAQGSATGLGSNSSYAYSSSLGVALWQKGTYVAAVVVNGGISESDLKKAANAINARIH
jgi:hypothetical protein